MGNTDTKLNFRKAVIQLTTKTQPVETNDDSFWDQFWSDSVSTVQDFFTLIPAAEIRALREESPSNLATLCYKAVEKIVRAAEHSCRTQEEQRIVLNCVRLLTRLLPYIFEDPDWRGFFWSSVPKQSHNNSPEEQEEEKTQPLAHVLLNTLADLLFVPEFTVGTTKKGPDHPEDLASVDSCEYIWEAGVGCAVSPSHVPQHDLNRAEILKLLLTCCSELIYLPALDTPTSNPWVTFLTSTDNRHALPMFTSLLNVIFAYDPVGYGVPYNYLMFTDSREPLVEIAAQFLCVCVDQDAMSEGPEEISSNLFVNYLSRVHRDEDLAFLLKGFSRLLNNPLIQTYLPASCKRIQFYQELLVLFWKFCDYNKKFLYFVLKSSDVLDVLVPILYYLNDARADQSRLGLVHIGVFILLLLSGERNFGVRLNKPFVQRIPVDVPVFTGTHGDLLILVFHKMITTGHPKLQPLFDCLLTIVVNVSPYLKSLSMVAANKLLHLLEAFSTPWFLYSNPNHHHLVFFLLEVFNNLIQYQFDGNTNLVYACIRKRAVFHQLANLSSEHETIHRALEKKGLRKQSAAAVATAATAAASETETLAPGKDAEPGTLKATLAATPSIKRMTEETTPLPTTPGAAAASMWSEMEQAGNDETQDISAIADKMKPSLRRAPSSNDSVSVNMSATWVPTPEWVVSWKKKLPLQTIMRLLQVLVPQVEKICIDRGLTDETEIIKFLQHGTLVGLLPVPHPILIRKYQPNSGTTTWFRTYLWGVIYLRNMDPPIWYDTDVKMFEIQRV